MLPDLKDSASQRQTMVDCQIRTFGVTDQRLIGRLLDVPRERFLPDDVRALAYSDIGFTLPTAGGRGSADARYLLPPLIIARLIQGGRVRGSDRVLDVACGSGYSTAILAALAKEVLALEAQPEIKVDLKRRLASVGLDQVRTLDGDLAEGAESDGPFDVIVVNGTVETRPDKLLAQLAPGGRLVTIRRDEGDPTGRAAKAVCFEKGTREVGMRVLFDASAPTLPAFKAAQHFVF